MKFFIKSLFLFIVLFAAENANAQNASVVIKLRNIEHLQGTLLVALTSDSSQFANFNTREGNLSQKIVVESSEQRFVFKNLIAGWYAIAVFQDLNGNDSLDTKRFKIPAEPFGFSNNALAKFRPPWFKDARFYIEENKQNIQTINLINRKPKRVKTDTSKNEK